MYSQSKKQKTEQQIFWGEKLLKIQVNCFQ